MKNIHSLTPLDNRLEAFCLRLQDVRRNGNGWMACCPAHEDRNPSLSISEGDDGRVLLHCFAGCDPKAIVEAVGLRLQDLYPSSKPKAPKPTGLSLADFAEAKQLPVEFLQECGVHDSHYQGVRSVAFRYRDREGKFLFDRHRLSLRGGFRQPKGTRVVPYGLCRLKPDSRKTLLIVEGESDALTCWYAMPAVDCIGVPGANGWQAEWWGYLDGYKQMIVWQEPDGGGEAFVAKIQATCPGELVEKVKILQPDKVKDPSDLWIQVGGDEARFVEAIKAIPRVPISDWEPPAKGEQHESHLICLEDVEPQAVQWLWKPYIPIGKITLMVGDPGIGKSYLSLVIATAVSQGRGAYGLERAELGKVLIWSAEDDLSDTLRPRLDVLGANCRLIFAQPNLLAFTPSELSGTAGYEKGLEQLEADLNCVKPSLCIIDPFAAFVNAGLNSHAASHMRAISKRIAALAEQFHCAILVVAHLNKSQSTNALYRISGSVDIPAAARSVLLVGEHPEQRGLAVMTHAKSNLSQKGQSLAFTVQDGRFKWMGEVDLTPSELIRGAKADTLLLKAEAFLQDALADGERPASEVHEEAKAWGISEVTLRRAKYRLRIATRKDGKHWRWALPTDESTKMVGVFPKVLKKSEDVQGDHHDHHDHLDHLDHLEHLWESKPLDSNEMPLTGDALIEAIGEVFGGAEEVTASMPTEAPDDDLDGVEDFTDAEILAVLAEQLGYPRLPLRSGEAVLPGQEAWNRFIANGSPEQHARALERLQGSDGGKQWAL